MTSTRLRIATSALSRLFTREPVREVDIPAIVLLWLASTLIVNPVGNFPLLDDWVFGAVVRTLLQSGDYRPLGHELMTLVSNVIWGALFCLPTGFSFTSLRISTIVSSAIGIAGVYCLASEFHIHRHVRLIITLTVAFSPIYYVISHTFMTDVPFLAVSVWSTVYLVRYLKQTSTTSLLVGSLLLLIATLSRELAVSIGGAFFVAFVLRGGVSVKSILIGGLPLAISLSGFATLWHWIATTGRSHQLFDLTVTLLQNLSNPLNPLKLTLSHAYMALVTVGLFSFPILLTTMRGPVVPKQSAVRSVSVGFGTIILCALLRVRSGEDILLPFYTSFMVGSGVGPTMLRDTYLLNLGNMKTLPASFWAITTMVGVVGGIWLVAIAYLRVAVFVRGLRYIRSSDDLDISGIFVAFCILCYSAFVLPSPIFFDRYLIFILPFVAITIARGPTIFVEPKRGVTSLTIVAGYALVTLFAVFSVAAARDYLTWNRVRWHALDELMSKDGVGPEEIDGGYEFNGTYLFSMNFEGEDGHSWWWVKSDRYQVGFGPVAGYTVIRRYPYYHLLPPHMQDVVVLKKNEASHRSELRTLSE